MTHTRTTSSSDREGIKRLYLAAFPEEERQPVADLAVNLLAEKTTPETLSLVAEADDAVIGHIAFSPISSPNTNNFQGYILAPLAVHPSHQKQRIGTNLIEAGIQQLSTMNADIVFVYGDPRYYSRFGFDSDLAAHYTPPYQLQYPFGWQAKPLTDAGTFPPAARLTCVTSLRNPQLW